MSGAVLLLLAAAAAAVAFAVGRSYLKRKRQQGFARFAVLQGLQYAPEDPFGLVGLPFALLDRGDGRGIENVLWGSWHEISLHAFDYWYYDETTDAKGRTSRTYHRFSCAVAPVDADLPHLAIARENLFTRLADGIGLPDIQFESEEFNRRFDVKSEDERFSYAFVDGRMMEWLLRAGEGYGFEVNGDRVLVACRRLDPMGFVPLLGTTRDLLGQIPRVVFSLYPKSG